MVNDMDVVPEDVRGADVGEGIVEATEDLIADLYVEATDNARLRGLLTRAADHLARLALRSPEPAAALVEAAGLSWVDVERLRYYSGDSNDHVLSERIATILRAAGVEDPRTPATARAAPEGTGGNEP
jgi:hypothetical protein